MKNRIKALAQFLDCKKSEIENVYDYTFEVNNEEYMVLTDEEADEAWEESLDSYLEECIYPELPEFTIRYFDDEAWRRDAKYDGRGHSLNHYDGSEEEETVDGETYYIYRIN